MKLPYELRQELLEGNLVLFLGAGFTKHFLPGMPTWEQLLKRAYSRLTGNPDEIFSYFQPTYDAQGNKTLAPAEYLRAAQVFELVKEKNNKNAPADKLLPSIHRLIQEDILHSYDSAAARIAVAGKSIEKSRNLPLLNWITTNFDTFIEDAILSPHLDDNTACVLSRPIQTRDFRDLSASRTLFKIHGSVNDPSPEQSIVITEDDYNRFIRQDKYLTHKLFVLFCEKTVVFVGYSLNDPNIQSIYSDVLFDQKGLSDDESSIRSFAHVRPAFFVSHQSVNESSRTYYRHKKIEYIENYSIDDLFNDLWEIFERNRERVADVTGRVLKQKDQFTTLIEKLGSIQWNKALPWEEDVSMSTAHELMDLIEFFDLSSRPPQPIVAPFGIPYNSFLSVVQSALSTIEFWNVHLVGRKQIDLCDLILERLETGFANRKTVFCKRLIQAVENGLVALNALDTEAYVTRQMKIVFQYDGAYYEWGDYVYSLERYIYASALYTRMNVGIRRRYIDRLYQQLKRCGRQSGESWYSVEEIYRLWHRFDVDCWPDLEKRIKKAAVLAGGQSYFTGHEQEMLDHLAPGADYRKFLPRYPEVSKPTIPTENPGVTTTPTIPMESPPAGK